MAAVYASCHFTIWTYLVIQSYMILIRAVSYLTASDEHNH